MEKLNQNAINDVLGTEPRVRVEVLFRFLVEGKSHRQIEKESKGQLTVNDGWSSWKIIHFFGFGTDDKGKYFSLNIQDIETQIELDRPTLERLSRYHLTNEIQENNEDGNWGTDILRSIKMRIGQAELREKLLNNYEIKCALCNINSKDLLVASHIKPWSKSSKEERVDITNAILLCRLHDALFENGYLSLSDDDKPVVIFKDVKKLEIQEISTKIKFRNPIEGQPNPIYLSYHRKKHKIECS